MLSSPFISRLFIFVVGLLVCTLSASAHVTASVDKDTDDARPLNAERVTRKSISELNAPHVCRLNKFGLELFARIASSVEQNVVISPLSVASSLTMLLPGVTKNSQSETELRSLIGKGFISPGGADDPAVDFRVANSVWSTGLVLNGYKRRVEELFGAKICPVPSDVAVINDWVSEATNGEIPSILNEIPDDTVAFLLNAIFFKASWKIQFDPDKSLNQPFFGPRGRGKGPQITSVKMMVLRNEFFLFDSVPLKGKKDEYMNIVELPYGDGAEYTATIALPTGETTLEEIIKPFKKGNIGLWDEWTRKLKLTKLHILGLPRFKIEFGVKKLRSTLNAMGLTALFTSSAIDPQLLRLTSDPKALIDDVLHKATMEVTEEGTTASAATVVIITSRSRPPGEQVICNRPFLFVIRNVKSGAILFIAKVDNPNLMSP